MGPRGCSQQGINGERHRGRLHAITIAFDATQPNDAGQRSPRACICVTHPAERTNSALPPPLLASPSLLITKPTSPPLQLLTITYPIVGNYGVPDDTVDEYGLPTYFESDKVQVRERLGPL